MRALATWLRGPWRRDPRRNDPYWDFFINAPPADPANLLRDVIRNAPEGNVFPTRADLHTPEVTTQHVKEMARYLGADLTGVAALEHDADGHPFAVICVLRADDDPARAPGIGGQTPVQNGLFVTFVLSAWIRELGFRATAAAPASGSRPDGVRLAAAAKLGTLDRDGRLLTPRFGTHVHVADVIRTDLPLVPA